MGLLDFLRRKPEPESLKEKVDLDSLSEWLKRKNRLTKDKEDLIFKSIRKEVSTFIPKLAAAIKTLKEADLSKSAAPDKALLIVRSNLDKYLVHLSNFQHYLENLSESRPEKLISSINKEARTMADKSKTNHEKASLLLGKDLIPAAKLIGEFVQSLNARAKANKSLFRRLARLSLVEEDLEKKDELDAARNTILKHISDLDEETLKAENQIDKNRVKSIKLKSSKSYLKKKKQIEELSSLKEKLLNETFALKAALDFKKLAAAYHHNESKMNIIKAYKNDFLDTFQKDGGKPLLKLFQEDISPDKKVIDRIKLILDLQDKLANMIIEPSELDELATETARLRKKIEAYASRIEQEHKRLSKIESAIKEIVSSIQLKLEALDVVLVTKDNSTK